MFIPIRTDRPPRHAPVITELLIAVNVLVYLSGQIGRAIGQSDLETFVTWFAFDPRHAHLWQMLTYQFMHDQSAPWHVLFNMLFLWVFGGPVEDRFGAIGFLVFYLVGGILAVGAHMLVSRSPVIGASGSVAACTGAFLALYPRSRIFVFYLFGGAFGYLSSLWFIGLYFAIDLTRQLGTWFGASGDVAYMAHLGGYMYGFGVAFVLLATKRLASEEYDVFYLFKQARRRAAMRAANRATAAGAWESASADTGDRLAKQAAKAKPLSALQTRELELRAEINRLASAHDLSGAAAKYRTLLNETPRSVFSQERQLELANQFCAENDYVNAAAAYQLLLERYPNLANAAEVQLILAVVYGRYLHEPERARSLIQIARPRLHDTAQKSLADALAAEMPPPAASSFNPGVASR